MRLSRKQRCVASSTTEAEYIATSTGGKETQWLRHLIGNLGVLPTTPSSLFSDDQAVVCLVRNSEYRKLTKHIDVHYHVIREYQECGVVDISYISTHQ